MPGQRQTETHRRRVRDRQNDIHRRIERYRESTDTQTCRERETIGERDKRNNKQTHMHRHTERVIDTKACTHSHRER